MFIAGATSTGAVTASRSVPSRSSAIPAAIFASVFAVAGATIARSAACARARCSIGIPGRQAQRSSATGRPESAWNVAGPTKRFAFSVMTTVTSAPSAFSRRSNSTAL